MPQFPPTTVQPQAAQPPPSGGPRTVTPGGGGGAAAALLALGAVSGGVGLPFDQATTFTATVPGAEVIFKPSGLPSIRETGTLWVTQGAVGGTAWSVEGLKWIGGEPPINKAKESVVVVAFFVLNGELWGAVVAE